MAVKQPKSILAGHTAGIFADMTLDGPEIGTLVAVVDRAKNLPNRRTMGKQDPYCAMRLGKEAKKTDTDRRGGQTPKWDQELRFTVHDSPDYYKMKVSVFNDDKKTDLIGEAYVSLHDLIKPGGGSNDLWHGLNYKGKYAGEIRMEMTYYDQRPREEKSERRRHRDKAMSITSDATGSVSGPRQLGPREVRRRPLPTSPAGNTPSPSTTPQSQAPPPPPKIPLSQPDLMYTLEPYVDQYPVDPYAQDHAVGQIPFQNGYQIYQPHHQSEPGYQDYGHQEVQYHEPVDQYEPRSPRPMLAQNTQSYPELSHTWDETGRRHSDTYDIDNSPIPVYDSPPPLPHSSHSAPEVPQYRPYKTSASPTKAIQYRDSPLRHSINQQEIPEDFSQEPLSYDAPPPPPKHRGGSAQKLQTDFPPSAYAPQPLRPTPRRPSIDERSPLQHIEREYDASLVGSHGLSRQNPYDIYTQSPTGSMHTPDRHGSYDAFTQSSPIDPRAHSRQGSFDPYAGQEIVANYNQQHYDPHQKETIVLRQQHAIQDDIDVYGRRNSRNAFVQEHQSSQTSYQSPRAGSYNDQELNGTDVAADLRNSGTYPRPQPNLPGTTMSTPIRPLPSKIIPTQSPGHIPTRKAVSPSPYSGPYAEDTSRRISLTPFGPDDYDVLNPASGPATNENTPYETEEQSKESARLAEVAKLRDQGPIIGNDGRVIDPSDHLPSDTWAPEPERKQPKPEHVIHIRTKNGPRSQITPVSSPASRIRGPAAQSSPIAPTPTSAPPSTGRSRLQKPLSTRPLPTQPYQHPQMQPQAHVPSPSHSPLDTPIRQPRHRNSYNDMSPGGIERPSLSEYQVPVANPIPKTNTYSPRTNQGYQISNHSPSPNHSYSHNQQQQQRQPKMPYVEDYQPSPTQSQQGYNNPGYFNDPLAMEMSMIDIGPSRPVGGVGAGRTALRQSRGY